MIKSFACRATEAIFNDQQAPELPPTQTTGKSFAKRLAFMDTHPAGSCPFQYATFTGPWRRHERASVSRGANPGTDSQFPANCAGNLVSVPGSRRIPVRYAVAMARRGSNV